MSTFEDIVKDLKQYDDDAYLGFLTWYSVSEGRFEHSVVVREMHAAGLEDLALPPVPRGSDVFKRVTTAAQRKKQPVTDPFQEQQLRRNWVQASGVRVNFLVREVGKDRDSITRQIVRETVDAGGKKLSYDVLAELEYSRGTEKILVTDHKVDYDDGAGPQTHQDAAVGEMVDEIRAEYKALTTTLTGYAIRSLVRTVMGQLFATSVRPSGSVYFVRKEHAARVAGLEKLLGALPDCNFHSLPLLDDTKQRAMVVAAYEAEGIGEVDRILSEIAAIGADPHKTITSAQFATYVDDFNTLTAKMAEYSDLLDMKMAGVASRLEIFQNQLPTLMSSVG